MRSETKPSQDEEKNGQEPLLPPIQPVIDFGSVVIKNSRAAIHCLTIAGQIEGHMQLPNTQKATKYEHVLPLLAYLEESDDIDGVLFLLNTVGGDVEAGLAIAELISGMKKPTVSLVLGGGHSIGVPLAVAPMVTMIAPSASMTIHPVRTSGTIIAAPQTYQYFERLQERIVRFVTKNSRIGRDEFLRLMMDTQDLASDVGSVLYGEEAVACGLIQRIAASPTRSTRCMCSLTKRRSKSLAEFADGSRQIELNHFLSGRVPDRKYNSGCKCANCSP